MNLKTQVHKIMTKAMDNFSTKEGVKPHEVAFFIHTKNTDLAPEYFYSVKNSVKKSSDGSTLAITFNDILGVRFDFAGREFMASPFLKGILKNKAESINASPKEIYINISKKENDDELTVLIYKGGSIIEQLTLEDIFQDI